MTTPKHGHIERGFEPHPPPLMTVEESEDYKGTAYMSDRNAVVGAQHLDEILGLDRSKWSIVGMRLHAATGQYVDKPDNYDGVTVYAVEKDRAPEHQRGPGALLGDEEPIEVVEFRCHDLTLADVLRCMESANIELWSRTLEGRSFYVVGKSTIPEGSY
ncbi:hypothetical protein [Corynebacterium glyciniphilum]|uniref:hypothetical protein n=1 Tax=Corynebacterium glyciniphilum TaxID=1404244 RepID=UPI0026531813|nr:hypothetical protein [Corynebacterium glyciniphilum]MDN6707401.1 hypothetical protein [Corynebacterium glyciniphilum]